MSVEIKHNKNKISQVTYTTFNMSIASKSTIIPLLYPEIARSIERISKTNRSKADITETITFDYVWDGNNIFKSTETGGSSVVYETTYKYDKNKNPKYYYYLTGDFDPSMISKTILQTVN